MAFFGKPDPPPAPAPAAKPAAAKNPKVKYGVMLNQRTIGLYKKLKDYDIEG